MKTVINYTYLFILVLVMLSCQPDRLIVLDIDDALSQKKEMNLSVLASTIDYIYLEITEDVILGTVIYVNQIGEDSLLVADDRGCYIFNLEGKCVRKIGVQGKGPGEYARIKNVVYEKESEQIYITSWGKGILVFDLKGNYKQTILPDKRLGAWCFIKDDIMVDLPNYRGDNPYKLAILNQSGDTVKAIPNYDFFSAQQPLAFTNDPFFNYKGEKNYYRLFNDTIFHIDEVKLEIIPKYLFKSLGHVVSQELRADASSFVSTSFDYIIPWKIIETDRFLFINALRNKQSLIPFLYDKQKYIFFLLKYDEQKIKGFQNDVNAGLPFFPNYQLGDNKLCAVYSAADIFEYMEGNSSVKIDLPDGFSEESNPCIAILTLK